MKFLNFFLFLWVSFALLYSDPDPLTWSNQDSDPKHCQRLKTWKLRYISGRAGSWKDWSADPDAREALKNSILYAYYFFYAIIITFCFLIIPSNYFYHGLSPVGEEQVPYRIVPYRVWFTFTWVRLFALMRILYWEFWRIPYSAKPAHLSSHTGPPGYIGFTLFQPM